MTNEFDYTLKEEEYAGRLANLATAAFGEQWRDFWPDHDADSPPEAWLCELGPFDLDTLFQKVEECAAGRPAICFIEHVTLPWTIRLGAAFKLDSRFFIEHVKSIDDEEEAEWSLQGLRPPSSGLGVKSSRTDNTWGTLRGYVMHGKKSSHLTDEQYIDPTKRRRDISWFDDCVSHTNVSFHKVDQWLHIMLVDRLPEYTSHYTREGLGVGWWPNQTIVWLGLVDFPGCVTLPRLFWRATQAVWYMARNFRDKISREIILHALTQNGIDDFLCRMSISHCEHQLEVFEPEVRTIAETKLITWTAKDEELFERIPNLREVLGLIRDATRANRDLEQRLARARGVKTLDFVSIPPSSDFERLDCEVRELENALLVQFHRASSARTSAKMEEGIKQAETQHRQKMMIAWIALIYTAIMLAAGIAAVDLEETWGLLASMAIMLGPASLIGLATLAYLHLPACFTTLKTGMEKCLQSLWTWMNQVLGEPRREMRRRLFRGQGQLQVSRETEEVFADRHGQEPEHSS